MPLQAERGEKLWSQDQYADRRQRRRLESGCPHEVEQHDTMDPSPEPRGPRWSLHEPNEGDLRVIKPTIEYVGFRTGPDHRQYFLRSHFGTEIREYTVGIPHSAFTAGRVRFQDGPEICYLKVLREMEAASAAPSPATDFTLTDAELAAYVTAHTPTPRRTSFSVVSPRPPAPESTEQDHKLPHRS